MLRYTDFMQIPKKRLYVLIGLIVLFILLMFGMAKFARRNINITNDESGTISNARIGKLTGINCAHGHDRPFAVMLSSDKEARPLAGIGEADVVFEMPVVESGFTRMMAVYQCGRPHEVGSIRSSRLDFLPLALGLDAIYSHFGGEREVLEELNKGVINNIDGLKYDGITYYRKDNIPRPHNAFTNFPLLIEISKKLDYNLVKAEIEYPHATMARAQNGVSPVPLFNDDFKVLWSYNKETNSYFRTRSGSPEIDKNTDKQVSAKNVIIMKTGWSPINKDYIRVKTVGSGGAIIYRDGAVITGTWEKTNDRTKLMFFDQNHKEIKLAPGNIWIEIDAK